MKYKNAVAILPPHLVQELQQYLDGCYLYIPSKKLKSWGEVSGYRKELAIRNEQITQSFRSGVSIYELACKFSLSEHTICKIVYFK